MSGSRRQHDIITGAVRALRQDQPLLDAVYAGMPVPDNQSDRTRIHEGDPGRKDKPVQVAVMPVTSGGTWRGGEHSITHTIECTIECSQRYYERHSHLGLVSIHDRCNDVLTSPIGNGIYPLGPAGSGSVHEIGDSGRRTRTGRWRVRVHRLSY